ncbi:zinc finger MYM-type protein 1 [Trichonephila clavipes]|nr:zinc finger MYM-type protein 1 [Trichonephila clavipes]
MLFWLTRKENKSVLDKQLQEQLRKDTEYYHNVLQRVIAVVKYLAIRGVSLRGTEEVFRSPHIMPRAPKGHGPALDTAYPGRWIGRGEALVARVAVVAGEIQEMPGVFANVRHSLRQRCEACIFAGGHFYE